MAKSILEDSKVALNTLNAAIANLLEKLNVNVVDRGIWVNGGQYYFSTINPATGVVETSDVWFCGCRWRCLVSGTTQQPSWKATHWMFIEGNSQFSLEFAPVNTIYRIGAVDLQLRIIASIHNQDVTADVLPMDVVWTRYSEDADGTPRTASDNVWNAAHAGAGHAVHITDADLDFNGRIPHVIRFSAEATLRDGAVEPAVASLSLFDLN
ncbi:MAG: hypothetical protein K2M06_02660 [Muribaculaceae bacterium]|nr:hypothetical protein [Muribaculaceae bacterium]